MDCPYCGKFIRGMTGLQEARNFQVHLRKCKKNPNRLVLGKTEDGVTCAVNMKPTLLDAVGIRAESGQ